MKNSTNTPANLSNIVRECESHNYSKVSLNEYVVDNFHSQMKQAKTGWVINISSKQKANNVVKENKNGRS